MNAPTVATEKVKLCPDELDKITIHNGEVIRAILFLKEEMTEIHWFKLPDYKEHRFYQTTVSYGGFKRRDAKRLMNNHNRRRLDSKFPKLDKYWSFKPVYEFDAVEQMEAKYNIYKGIPVQCHASLWDFYKAIGYEYKKQRYVKESK